MKHASFDILVVGAGPAGLAAASSAAQGGASVALVDDNAVLGGQIWRADYTRQPGAQAQSWLLKGQDECITHYMRTRVIAAFEPGKLLVETPAGSLELRYKKLILTTGARERFLPFPGWTLPGVMGVGGLQALVKGGLPIVGKRVIIAGSGPLLLAVAVYLKRQGARVSLIAEQASLSNLTSFALRLPCYTAYLWQAAGFARELVRVPLKTSCWVTHALGEQRLEAVVLRHGKRSLALDCDYLACGFGLTPNTELAAALNCELQEGMVHVNEWQESSQSGVYCAGEITGIGGLELSLLEGQIAGLAATERVEEARHLFALRARAQAFAALQSRYFALRPELRALADAGTIVCRCEDVTYGELEQYTSWRGAKLQTRCGMGPCQGRICGAATDFLFGWTQDAIRPPLASTRIASLASMQDTHTKEVSQ